MAVEPITGLTTGITGGTFGSGYNHLTPINVTISDPNGSNAAITGTAGIGGTSSIQYY